MQVEFHTVCRLVERTVEGRQEEHNDLGAHSQIEEEIRSGQVGQLKQGT